MKYVIIYDKFYKGNNGINQAELNIERIFDNPNEANEAWKAIRAIHGVANIRTKKIIETYHTVSVQFKPNGKLFTYLTKSKVDVGDIVAVRGYNGIELLKVVESKEQTREELEAVLPMNEYKYVIGKIISC